MHFRSVQRWCELLLEAPAPAAEAPAASSAASANATAEPSASSTASANATANATAGSTCTRLVGRPGKAEGIDFGDPGECGLGRNANVSADRQKSQLSRKRWCPVEAP